MPSFFGLNFQNSTRATNIRTNNQAYSAKLRQTLCSLEKNIITPNLDTIRIKFPFCMGSMAHYGRRPQN